MRFIALLIVSVKVVGPKMRVWRSTRVSDTAIVRSKMTIILAEIPQLTLLLVFRLPRSLQLLAADILVIHPSSVYDADLRTTAGA